MDPMVMHDTVNCTTAWKAHRADPLSTENGGAELNLSQDVGEQCHLA
jgi:hypothetical protein